MVKHMGKIAAGALLTAALAAVVYKRTHGDKPPEEIGKQVDELADLVDPGGVSSPIGRLVEAVRSRGFSVTFLGPRLRALRGSSEIDPDHLTVTEATIEEMEATNDLPSQDPD